MRFDVVRGTSAHGWYAFRLSARPRGGYAVKWEAAEWKEPDRPTVKWEVNNGQLRGEDPEWTFPRPSVNQLYLVHMSGEEGMSRLFDTLAGMRFYRLNPEAMRIPQRPDAGDLLVADGSNVAAVFEQLSRERQTAAQRVLDYLQAVTPTVKDVKRWSIGPFETLEIVERQGSGRSQRFLPTSVSDGTLRALGVLVALFQFPPRPFSRELVGIEEPEMALHPAAVEVLFDALRQASTSRQVIVTSHSAELLDRRDLPVQSLLAVSLEGGATTIGELDQAGKAALARKLRTPGELMRMDQLRPERRRSSSQASH